MNKVVAITGATGFIGRRLIARHIAIGDEVRFLTRDPESLSLFPGATGYLIDLAGSNLRLNEFLSGVDVLYHLAAELYDECQMWPINVAGTQKLLIAASGNIKRWVQLSSTGVYGKTGNEWVDETRRLNPNNAYERSKAEADRLVEGFVNKDLIDQAVILRPSNVYGPDMPNQSLFQLISFINRGWFFFIGKKGALVNYIHVDNVVDALMKCSEAILFKRVSIYIVSDFCTLERLVEIIACVLGRPMPKLRLPKCIASFAAMVMNVFPSMPFKPSRVNALTGRVIYSSQLIAEIGHSNHISIDEGFRELINAWRESNLSPNKKS